MRTWLNRQRSLADFAFASLGRRRARTTLLLLVYAAVVAVMSAVVLYAQAVRREAALVLGHAPSVVVQRLEGGRYAPVPESYVDALAGLRGVQRVEGRLWGYYYDPVIRATCTVMVPPAGSPWAVPDGTVRVGAALARSRAVNGGARLALVTTDGAVMTRTVAEVLPEESELLTADLILLGAEDFKALLRYPAGVYTDIALSVANPAEHRNIAEKVVSKLPDARTIVRDDVVRTYASVFDWREGLLLAFFMSVVGAFALFAFDRASGLSADEARDIAILKAVGWDTGDVLRMKLWEGAALSFAAFALGYLAAYLFVFYVPVGPFDTALRGWTAVRPRLPLTPAADALHVATLCLLTVVPYTAAVLVPVWRAAVTEPDAVIRG